MQELTAYSLIPNDLPLPQPQQEAQILIPLIIAIGVSLLAQALFRPKDQEFLVDNKPNTAMLRGSFIPLVIGRRRVGATIMYVGDRTVQVEEESSGGKGFGSSTKVKTNVYYEKGLHGICVGPAAILHGIYADGKLIPGTSNIDSRFFPSGSSIALEGYGNGRIYWGELTQPVDYVTAGALEIATALPYVCYIVWDSYRIGGRQWPVIEYDVECPACAYQPGPVENPDVDGKGVNPAQAFFQIWSAPYPHGAAIPTSMLDCASIATLGALAYVEGIGMNMLIQNGDDAQEAIGLILQDFTVMMPEMAGIVSLIAIRNVPGSVPDLSDDLLLPPRDQIKTKHETGFGNAIVYTYDDRDHNYKVGTIDFDKDSDAVDFDDDGLPIFRFARETKKIDMPTITVRDVASALASRRQVEDLDTPTSITENGLRQLRLAQPGQLFNLPNVGRVRLGTVKISSNKPSVEMQFVVDPYQQATITYSDPGLPDTNPSGALEEDIRFRGVELPFLMANGTGQIAVFRIRDNPSIYAAPIIVSADNLSYSVIGSQDNPATGGLVAADWNPSNDTIIEEGPTFTIDDNGDEITVPTNLSAAIPQWLQGDQIMVVGNEFLYVREIVFVSGLIWKAKGVIRGRAGTAPAVRTAGGKDLETIVAGTPAYVIRTGKLNLLSGPLISTAAAKWLKTLPANDLGEIPAGAVVEQPLSLTSQATVTPRLAWLEAGGATGASTPNGRRDRTYASTEDLVFEWLPTAKSQGAGMQGFGQPSAQATVTGNFVIEVQWDPTFASVTFEELTTQETYTVSASSALGSDGIFRWTYTAAQRVIDGTDIGLTDNFTSSLAWQFKITHSDGTVSEPLFIRPRYVAVDKIPFGI